MKRGPKTRQTALEKAKNNCLIARHAPSCLKAPRPKTTPCGSFSLSKDSVYASASQLFFSEGASLAVCKPLAERLAPPKIALPTLKHLA